MKYYYNPSFSYEFAPTQFVHWTPRGDHCSFPLPQSHPKRWNWEWVQENAIDTIWDGRLHIRALKRQETSGAQGYKPLQGELHCPALCWIPPWIPPWAPQLLRNWHKWVSAPFSCSLWQLKSHLLPDLPDLEPIHVKKLMNRHISLRFVFATLKKMYNIIHLRLMIFSGTA